MKKKITPAEVSKEAQSILSQRGKELGDYTELYENLTVRINLMLGDQLKEPIKPWQVNCQRQRRTASYTTSFTDSITKCFSNGTIKK